MSSFRDRLGKLLDEKNISQSELARAIGASKSTISKYLNVDTKNHEAITVLEIAKFLNVNSEWLYGITDIRKPFYEPSIVDIYEKLSDVGKKEVCDFASYLLSKESFKENEEAATCEFALVGLTAAGNAIPYGDPLYDTVSIHDTPNGADFALRVKGDSMEPLIKNGSIVLVKHQPMVENGEIAIIDIGGEVTCKKVCYSNGSIELKSINPNYEPIKPKEARIIGKVIL